MTDPTDNKIEAMPAPPWVQFFKQAIGPVVEALAELKAEYQVDRDEWIARLDEIDERLDELARRIERIERHLATGAGS
jgi:uncharacterized protein HemX